MPTVMASVDGSRPTRSQASISSPRMRASRSSGRPNHARFQASAWRAVSSSIRGIFDATRIGMSLRAGGRSTASFA